MSFQLYKTRLKCLVRNKEVMFWTYLFPILLATCFFFTLNNLWGIESFETIPVAYVNGGTGSDPLKEAMSTAEMSDGTPFFSVTDTDQETAETMLEKNKIDAYIVGSEEPILHVKQNGLNQTIIKSFLDSYRQTAFSVQTIMTKNPEAINKGLMKDVMDYDTFINEAKDEKKPDALLIYFYALLAYTCIFAANNGLDEVINIQADQSKQGARVNVSPVHKMKLFLCNLSASFTFHSGSIVLLFLYMYYGMKINFGKNLLLTFITCLIGSLAGLALGATVGVWVKKNADFKEAVLTIVVLGGGFLSGMMVGDMKYLIAENVPILSYINPVNLVADSFYSLYYFDTYERFTLNIVILCAMTVVLCIASYIGLRRKSYASI
jgi:ABC-2 type transport system permease protein